MTCMLIVRCIHRGWKNISECMCFKAKHIEKREKNKRKRLPFSRLEIQKMFSFLLKSVSLGWILMIHPLSM